MRKAAASPRPFLTLLSAAEAIERAQPDALAEAIQQIALRDLLRVAARHRCLGHVHRGLLEFKIHTPRARAYFEATREHRAKAALQAYGARKQLFGIIGVLNEANVPFVLLKGAARLFHDDAESTWNTMYDLDLLVPRQAAANAMDALLRKGYRPLSGGFQPEHYASAHHHLIPLLPPEAGLPVELHVELASLGTLSTKTDWSACEQYFEQTACEQGRVRWLNPTGSGVNLLAHSVGIHRLHDVVLLCQLLKATHGLHQRLAMAIAGERFQAVALQATLALSARLAGLGEARDPAIAKYIAWVQRREDLPRYVRGRSQFVDAWYCNRSSLFGPATRRALPPYVEPSTSTAVRPALYAFRVCNRLAVSLYAGLAGTVLTKSAP